ncbi:MAG: hypothetical protein IPI14_09965 [Polaromonas sp.]|nr:hypothetical protein [Polaromonas sp.]
MSQHGGRSLPVPMLIWVVTEFRNVGAGVVDGDAANMGQLRIVDKSVKTTGRYLLR